MNYNDIPKEELIRLLEKADARIEDYESKFGDTGECGEQFRTIAEFSPSGILILSGDAILYINPAWEKLIGFEKAEAYKLNPFEFIHPDMREEVIQRQKKRMLGDSLPFRSELKCINMR